MEQSDTIGRLNCRPLRLCHADFRIPNQKYSKITEALLLNTDFLRNCVSPGMPQIGLCMPGSTDPPLPPWKTSHSVAQSNVSPLPGPGDPLGDPMAWEPSCTGTCCASIHPLGTTCVMSSWKVTDTCATAGSPDLPCTQNHFLRSTSSGITTRFAYQDSEWIAMTVQHRFIFDSCWNNGAICQPINQTNQHRGSE